MILARLTFVIELSLFAPESILAFVDSAPAGNERSVSVAKRGEMITVRAVRSDRMRARKENTE
jgi:hypothetical protein